MLNEGLLLVALAIWVDITVTDTLISHLLTSTSATSPEQHIQVCVLLDHKQN